MVKRNRKAHTNSNRSDHEPAPGKKIGPSASCAGKAARALVGKIKASRPVQADIHRPCDSASFFSLNEVKGGDDSQRGADNCPEQTSRASQEALWKAMPTRSVLASYFPSTKRKLLPAAWLATIADKLPERPFYRNQKGRQGQNKVTLPNHKVIGHSAWVCSAALCHRPSPEPSSRDENGQSLIKRPPAASISASSDPGSLVSLLAWDWIRVT